MEDIDEKIKDALKKNLTINISSQSVPYGNGKDIDIEVELVYGEETIAESSVTITEGE